MLRVREPIVMFGAGAGAKRAHACFRHRCRVEAFVDNDRKKHGSRFLGKPIIGPVDLARFPSERIYVASMYADQIYRQLTEDLRVDPARVVIVRKPILEGAYDVSPWTYAVVGALALLGLGGMVGIGYAIAVVAVRAGGS